MTVPNEPTFQFGCGACGHLLTVAATSAGQKCSCPYCRTILTIPVPIDIPKVVPSPRPPQTPNTVTPNTVTPNTITPNTITPNTITPNTITPNTITPPPFTATANTVQPPPAPNSSTNETSLFPHINTGSTGTASEYSHRHRTVTRGGAFGPEQRGLQAGVLGGLAMMGIAVVWFFAGLAAGYIFFYPPILFVVGVVGFIQGLATGNLSGRNRRNRY